MGDTKISPQWELDPRPLLYQRSALPLSYVGEKSENGQALASHGERGIRTSEANATDLQSVPFVHSGISPYEIKQIFTRWK